MLLSGYSSQLFSDCFSFVLSSIPQLRRGAVGGETPGGVGTGYPDLPQGVAESFPDSTAGPPRAIPMAPRALRDVVCSGG